MKNLPNENLNLQVSNGSSIRYADILGVNQDFIGTVHCNRGVSGIDGSTSTALGASMAKTDATTLFITGDMSFSYDLNGLATHYNNERLKIIILCNGGGGIFRFLNGPSDLPEFEEYFEVHKDIPTDKYAYAFGFEHLSADNEQSLQTALHKLFSNNKPTILAVHTNNKTSAKTLKNYYNRNK
jgi:2-succinyl-5-enolpyruvyl-6-hydroxy-3-cyclohexene-1-carboxylate synthase